MRRSLIPWLIAVATAAGCGGGDDDASAGDRDAATLDGGALDGGTARDAAPTGDAGPREDAGPPDAGPPLGPCRTRITYGSAWIHGDGHPAQYDDVDGRVTWDGACQADGGNSYAVLSNGWRPYFRGPSSCIIALDVRGACDDPPPSGCATRITYGPAWLHPDGHPAQHDDVDGVVTWDGACRDASGGNSSALLSNGWAPHFSGADACWISFRHEQCGGLFTNPVLDTSCPDPGVARDGDRYVMVCTSGNAPAAFPIRTSTDLVQWRAEGHVFPAGTRPGWASGDFWAPELHRVGARWVAYYSARSAADGSLAVGAATADDALGPYTDLGHPLVHDPSPGVIDAHFFDAPDGQRYLLWKVDGNAVGASTPIRIQRLAADGVTREGSPQTILTNDRAWEGALVEGPWMIHRAGSYYLFYSANGYATTRYAIGVARATSPTGPFTKLGAPILTSNAAWSGPGHGSVIRGPHGDWVHVYHAWVAGHVGEAPGRLVLVDRIQWADGWPHMRSMPSPRSQPPP